MRIKYCTEIYRLVLTGFVAIVVALCCFVTYWNTVRVARVISSCEKHALISAKADLADSAGKATEWANFLMESSSADSMKEVTEAATLRLMVAEGGFEKVVRSDEYGSCVRERGVYTQEGL